MIYKPTGSSVAFKTPREWLFRSARSRMLNGTRNQELHWSCEWHYRLGPLAESVCPVPEASQAKYTVQHAFDVLLCKLKSLWYPAVNTADPARTGHLKLRKNKRLVHIRHEDRKMEQFRRLVLELLQPNPLSAVLRKSETSNVLHIID